jgi:hypothetical protein
MKKTLEQEGKNKKNGCLWRFYCYFCCSFFILLVCLLITRSFFFRVSDSSSSFSVGLIQLLPILQYFFFLFFLYSLLLVLFFSIAIRALCFFFASNARKMFIWSIWRLMSRILPRFMTIYPRYLRTIHHHLL